MLNRWALYRLKNLARWKMYHHLGRLARSAYAALCIVQNGVFDWRTENDAIVEAKLWQL